MLSEKSYRSSGSMEFDALYEKLDTGSDLEPMYVKEDYDRSKPAAEYEDFEDDEEDDDDDGYGKETEVNEEDEYFEFFRYSEMYNEENRAFQDYSQAMLLEEQKWVERAIWLEQQVERLQSDAKTKVWVDWFQAKFDSLKDLDINIKGSDKEDPNTYVFYVHQFLKEYLAEQEKKARVLNDDDILEYIKHAEYTKDQQVYVDMPNMYPHVGFEPKDAFNTNKPEHMVGHNFREKLCMKVMTRERETDYFLTVYQRKELGNEKIYEKRLNLGGKEIQVKKLQFQPSKGQFILLSFIKGDER